MQRKTTVEILQDLIRIDTQNPPGNELPAVEYIREYCRNFSIDYQVCTYEEVRANIIVRIGPQTEENLVVLGHTDVVKADPDGWTHPPFAGVIEDGWLYGRGALDMKYVIAASMSIMARLKERESTLKRGIMFVFTADEENGSRYGIQKLLQDSELKEELSRKTVLNEGGGFSVFHRGECYYLFETGQKSVGRLRITVPKEPDTDPYFPTMVHERTLVQVLHILSELHLDERVPAATAHLREIFSAGKQDLDEKMQRLIATMSGSMITPTVIQGGARNPHLDKSVRAVVDCDCRLLPGMSGDEFISLVKAALSELPVEVELLQFTQGYEASIDKKVVKLLERSLQEHDPGIAALIPFITPGSNDGKYLKPLGCDVLGFAPLHREQTFPDILPRIHGVDERISLQSVDFCERVLFDVCSNYLTGGDEYAG